MTQHEKKQAPSSSSTMPSALAQLASSSSSAAPGAPSHSLADINVAKGDQAHKSPHEAVHLVQQTSGRVKA